MRKLNYMLALTAVIAISFSSCKKDDDEPEQKSTSENLTAGGWVLTSLTANPPVSGVTDFYAQYDACSKDDIEFYKAGGQYVFDEGATKCDPSDPQTTTSTWVLSADETKITITENGSLYELNLKAVSESSLTLTTVKEFDGIKYTFTATYRH